MAAPVAGCLVSKCIIATSSQKQRKDHSEVIKSSRVERRAQSLVIAIFLELNCMHGFRKWFSTTDWITITQHVPVHGITNPGDDAVDIGFSNKLSSKPRSAEAAVNNFWGVNSSSANAEIICEPDFYW
ncbi:hypothetical protein C5167_035334 [Papaver somniferum]|uniref:Uncharacterized protein n=1 Tax=Papaver somniferum TaxID=3469 RepID=A0A4Y7KIF3_PAPSO|nr:hypothetical protein C5167_035334 [Papaver somniferum]